MTEEVRAGQVWRPTKVGGKWRYVVGVHPAGVDWKTADRDPSQEHGFSRWETWNGWVERTGAVTLHSDVPS